MLHRYLVGPLNAFRAADYWRGPREAGHCLTFSARGDVDIVVAPSDSWETILTRLPARWLPDFIVLDLGYNIVPTALWSAPIPIIGLANDWNFLWHSYRHALPRCDLVFTDEAGVEVMVRSGWHHGRVANLYAPGRAFLEAAAETSNDRDIDVLFVGNFHPALQRERLPWIARLCQLADRRRIHVTAGVFGKDYVALLQRSRIAFNRSVRGECNHRAFEAAATGALLFQEARNLEIGRFFTPREEFVPYCDHDFEHLVEQYLSDDSARRSVAEAARNRARGYSYENLWQGMLQVVTNEWVEICRNAAKRGASRFTPWSQRVWQSLYAGANVDSSLHADLTTALEGPDAKTSKAELYHSRGLIGQSMVRKPPNATTAEEVVRDFQLAVEADASNPMASLNLVEALTGSEQFEQAKIVARNTLGLLEHSLQSSSNWLDCGHFPPAFDHFRVEWDRAAWSNAGNDVAEAKAKRDLLTWRVHSLLADLTGEMAHRYEAVLARPDLPPTRVALGHALLHNGRPVEASSHLRFAIGANPFDGVAARTWYEVLRRNGAMSAADRLSDERRLLTLAAPTLVPPEAWFGEKKVIAPNWITREPVKDDSKKIAAKDARRVVWEGDFWSNHSLAFANREFCLQLLALGQDLHLLPSDAEAAEALSQRLQPLLGRRFRPPDGTMVNETIATIHVRHRWPPNWTPPTAGHWVVMQPWEYGSPPRTWLAPMSTQVDEVWAPTRFVRDCYLGAGIPADRVHLVPYGVDINRFRPGLARLPLRTTKRFKFLFVGGTIYRKGIDVLLEAYAQEFTRSDDVCLVIKDLGVGSFYRGQTAETAIQRLRDDPTAPEVEYLDRYLQDAEIPSLFAACDCLVHPYRGEGFGLPIAEAMACGLPVIVTAYGAALDFCDSTNAYLIAAREKRFQARRIGEIETVDQPWLAEPDVQCLRMSLRRACEAPEECTAKGIAGRNRIAKHFTWEVATRAVADRIQALGSAPPRRFARRLASSVPRHRPRVSLCMIVRNEESNLADCLRSVSGLFDETVIVDTGSIDRTREIAASFGAQLYEFSWCDSFSAARNEGLRHATGDWIFWLDADDRLNAENRIKLEKLMGTLTDDVDAYALKCLCPSGKEPDSPATVVDHIRLFRNRAGLRWEYRVHEQILPSIRRAGGSVRAAEVVVHHVGYADSALRGRKLERDLRLLRLQDTEQPDEPFTMFNLGQVLLEMGLHTEALHFLRRSLKRSVPTDSIVRKLYALIANCERQLGKTVDALSTCRAGLAVCINDAELLFLQGLLQRERGDLAAAQSSFELLLRGSAENHFTSVDEGIRGYKARQNLGVVYRQLGSLAKAEAEWLRVTRERPEFVTAWLALADLYAEQKRVEDLEKTAVQIARLGASSDAALFRARSCLLRRDFAMARQLICGVIQQNPLALSPRVLLSHALLQDGADSMAAERALYDVLALDPQNSEARHNLAVLQRSRLEANLSAEKAAVDTSRLGDLYKQACQEPNSISESLPFIVLLATVCRHVTEFGSGAGDTTLALLRAEPEMCVAYDVARCTLLDLLTQAVSRSRFIFHEQDFRQMKIESTDLLLINLLDDWDMLAGILLLNADKVRRYIVICKSANSQRPSEPTRNQKMELVVDQFLSHGKFARLPGKTPPRVVALERLPSSPRKTV